MNEGAFDGIAQVGSLENLISLEANDDKRKNETLNSAIARRRFLGLDSVVWQVYQVIFVLGVLRRRKLDRSWPPDHRQAPVFVH